MNNLNDEARLREVYAQLLRHDEARARPFAGIWAAAQRRVARHERAWRPQRLVAAIGVASLLLVLTLGYRLVFESTGLSTTRVPAGAAATRAPSDAQQRHLAATDPIWSWRSPTELLLVTSDQELLRSVPRFGVPAFGPKINLPEEI